MRSYTSYFLGIPLPQIYLKEFGRVLEELRRIDGSIETVPSETPHITIYYLNKKSQYALEEITENIKPFSDILNEVTITVGGFDYFTKDNPKVLFLDVKYPKVLIDYKGRVSEVLEKYSAPDNNLPFHPHVTIGVIKSIDGQQSFNKNRNEILEKIGNISWDFKINEIILYGVDSTESPEYQEKLLTIPVR